MICVIAKLTPDATERLNILRKAVVSKKPPVKPFYGHITIATYLPDDECRRRKFSAKKQRIC